MDFSKLLKKEVNAARIDSTIFNKWLSKQITTSEAIRRFKENNDIDPDLFIDPLEFASYLSSLGYYGEEVE